MLTTTADGLLDDGARVFGPHERGRMAVPFGDVGLDMTDQSAEGVKRATPDRLAREDAEPRLDHVEPGRALRREVELDLRMLAEPRLHCGRRMGGRVVEDDVQFPAAVAAHDALHEAQEVSAGVPRAHSPRTRPLVISNAAYRLVRPLRRSSCVWRAATPGGQRR